MKTILLCSEDLPLRCSAAVADENLALQAKTMATELPSEPGRMMYMPAGRHDICCGLGGIAAAAVTIEVGPETAVVLNASLARLNKEFAPQKACFDFEHEGKEAMAWPLSFEWLDTPAPGIYATAEFSSLGKEYVQGKVVRAFSGSFFSDAKLPKRASVVKGKTYQPKPGERGSVENPARVIGLDFPYAGTLTNNPAFHANAPLWATAVKAEPGEEQARFVEIQRNGLIMRFPI